MWYAKLEHTTDEAGLGELSLPSWQSIAERSEDIWGLKSNSNAISAQDPCDNEHGNAPPTDQTQLADSQSPILNPVHLPSPLSNAPTSDPATKADIHAPDQSTPKNLSSGIPSSKAPSAVAKDDNTNEKPVDLAEVESGPSLEDDLADRRHKSALLREQRKRDRAQASQDAKIKQKQELEAAAEEARKAMVHEGLKQVLETLRRVGLSMGDLMVYFFDPANKNDRYHGFWENEAYFEEFMECITTRKNATPSGKRRVHQWAVEHVKRKVRTEAQAITRSRCLQSRHKTVDEAFVFDFRLSNLEDHLASFCPVMMEVVERFATSTQQQRAISKVGGMQGTAKVQKKRKIVTMSMLSLLREHNQYNNYFQQVLGIFMYSSGLQRQCFSVLSHLGVVTTYTSLVRPGPRRSTTPTNPTNPASEDTPPAEKKRPHRRGLLLELSDSCRAAARQHAEGGTYAVAYDNINFTSRVGEQTIGHTDKQENGTCATLYNVPGVDIDDLSLEDYLARLASAPPLKLDDLALTLDEHQLEQESLVHTALGIIVEHGGDFFTRYKKLLDSDCPVSTTMLPPGANTICPLPAMNVNEASVDGNIEAYTTITKELFPQGQPKPQVARLILGDQLSIAHLRKAVSWRIGDEDPSNSLAEVVLGPGLFHAEMIASILTFENSWGEVANSEANPASLRAHNTILSRKPIVLSSLPPFRTTFDLNMVSLYARVLCTLPLAAGVSSLDAYSRKLAQLDRTASDGSLKASWAQLKSDVSKQIQQFANRKVAAKLRKQREKAQKEATAQSSDSSATSTHSAGDMVFESGVLFFSDALLLRNFVEAVRRGDSGRIVAILKTWVLAFRGSKHTKYAYEMIVFLHNYQHVWTPSLRNAILNAWLVNTTGNPNSCIPADLLQEHLNLLIKTIYKAHGSNQSWEWLSMISPCVNVLRRVAREFHRSLGDRQGTKHSSLDLADDIRALSTSMESHHVYKVVPGRSFDPEDAPPTDTVSEGYRILSHGPQWTIDEFNKSFSLLQQRLKVPPISSKNNSNPTPADDSPDGLDPDQATPQTPNNCLDNGTEETGDLGDLGFEEEETAATELSETEHEGLDSWGRLLDEQDVIGIGFESEEDCLDDESDSDDEAFENVEY